MTKELVLGLAGCAALGSWWYLRTGTATEYKTDAVQRGRVQSTVAVTGTCSALVTVQVGSQVSGIVKALYADFNSEVHKGQVIAEIDPQPFQEKVNQAQAALESAQAAVLAAKATAQKAETDIRSAQDQSASKDALVAQSAAGEREAKISADRLKKLAAASIVSDDDFESAESNYNVAVADRQATEAEKHVAETTIDSVKETRDADLVEESSAEAQVVAAQAALEQAKLDLQHAHIVSPIDGVVIDRQVDVGQTVAASFQAPVIFLIAQDLTQMQVDADIDESEVSKVQAGMKAQFTVDAMPGRTFEATIRQVRKSPTNIQNVITYDAVMSVANPDLELLPGMTANVRIPVQVRENVLRISNTALRFRPGEGKNAPAPPPVKAPQAQQTVYVKNAAGNPVARTIQVGITDGLYSEVVSGDLHEGDPVILSQSTAN